MLACFRVLLVLSPRAGSCADRCVIGPKASPRRTSSPATAVRKPAQSSDQMSGGRAVTVTHACILQPLLGVSIEEALASTVTCFEIREQLRLNFSSGPPESINSLIPPHPLLSPLLSNSSRTTGGAIYPAWPPSPPSATSRPLPPGPPPPPAPSPSAQPSPSRANRPPRPFPQADAQQRRPRPRRSRW